MNITINNKLVQSINTSNHENAWSITDVIYVLKYIAKQSQVVLGGDILNSDLTHNYDSWYYRVDNTKSEDENVKSSVAIAEKYILNYINKNGINYYVVLVVN